MKVIILSSEAGHSKVNCFSRRKELNKVIADWYDFTVFWDMEALMKLSTSQVKVSKTPLELEQALCGQDMGSDCISSWSLLIFLLCISELLWLCRVVALKSLPVHSFNALIIPILRGCLQSLFNIPVPWYLFDTVLKVTSWPAFVSRCILDAYFSFYGLVLDIDMNCGCRLYRSFWQMDLTYAMDCLLNSITGMTVSPPYTQLWLSQTD